MGIAGQDAEHELERNVQRDNHLLTAITEQLLDPGFSNLIIRQKDKSYQYVNFAALDKLVQMADNILLANIYFIRENSQDQLLMYQSHITRWYYHMVTTIHVMRIMQEHGELDAKNRSFLRAFMDIYPPAAIQIDSILAAFLRTIRPGRPSDDRRFDIVLPRIKLPTAANPLQEANRHFYEMPFRLTQPDFVGLNIVFRRISQKDNTTDWPDVEFNMTTNENDRNAGIVPTMAAGPRANLRTQRLRSYPGFTVPPNDINPSGYQRKLGKQIERYYGRLRVPKLDLTGPITSIEQLTCFDQDPQFFGRIMTMIIKRNRYIKYPTTLDQLPLTPSDHILVELRHESAYMHPAYDHWLYENIDVPEDDWKDSRWPQEDVEVKVTPGSSTEKPKTGQAMVPVKRMTRAQYIETLNTREVAHPDRVPHHEYYSMFGDELHEIFSKVSTLIREKEINQAAVNEVQIMRPYAPAMYHDGMFPQHDPEPHRQHISGPYFNETENPAGFYTPQTNVYARLQHIVSDQVEIGRV